MTETSITKLEHSSLLIEHKGKRILFDPGNFSVQSEAMHNIDLLIITHTHGDHYSKANIDYIIAHSQKVHIVTNSEVSKLLQSSELDIHTLDANASMEIEGITITAHEQKHEEIFEEFGQVQNTGYYIDDIFFHPGDAFTIPNRVVKYMATVLIAPFTQIKTVLNFMNTNPSEGHIGVHDGMVVADTFELLENIVNANKNEDVNYKHLQINESIEL